MNKVPAVLILVLASFQVLGQVPGHVDKKTKEFFIISNPKADYRIFGYQYPNISTKKMICFSTHTADVRDNFYNCPLGSYFDTGLLKEGGKIVYSGVAGSFAKMIYIRGDGQKIIFYIPKSSFIIR